MKAFYKIENEKVQIGQGIYIPDGFVEYTVGEEPQDLAKALEAEAKEQELQAKLNEAKLIRDQLMLAGDTYTLNGIDYLISFTKNDGDGLVQVKSAFELGLASTVIVFENGTKLPITANEFKPFASWFVTERNEFFA